MRGIQPSTPARKFSEVSHHLILLEAPGEWRFVRGFVFFLLSSSTVVDRDGKELSHATIFDLRFLHTMRS